MRLTRLKDNADFTKEQCDQIEALLIDLNALGVDAELLRPIRERCGIEEPVEQNAGATTMQLTQADLATIRAIQQSAGW